ncbi:MAG: TIGR01777 family protein [Sphingobacteriales bacterium 17-39-43]|uniref:TIGR01777 family oxidoreductase n=1 Tax=Daejeonella sp. TaxID=2805397 RepID=UPI000BD7BD05|nr:TIGR01777 family oxidoreductase [Daejeonella sp.]OYX95501.1 MAG: TIGR01777 family protein [Sphingobacteriia bacterium 35-40-5]OYZ32891.1 MAG: TIGR01777 family protein [Sphingobacteriales bacterium 16-39-50]OZA26301.1 MAG: TIGR01777 family protein [Sphingobacteriales bacterium 17-39-43]HQS05398.1 TIGR01777 family oxidoreductase [Daejeonella sp.]HQT23528.1 TIGR01777 family oxidoreductase [Daejeonella sp.]
MNSDINSNRNILITGASGLIGTRLIKNLLEKGHRVSVLSRQASNFKGVSTYNWEIDKQLIDLKAFEGIDTIIHLAGAGIADKRWTKQRKQEIVDSRIRSTQLLYHTIDAIKAPIKTFISASAVGYYGDRNDEILYEESASGTGFLADCCKQWEAAVDQGLKSGIRVVKLRIGIVLSKKGGALSELARPVSFFVGAPLGSGKQWMPWIHLTDLVSIFEKAIENSDYSGTFNACTPYPVTNYEFTKILAKKLFRPVWPVNVPEFVLKTMLGEMSTVILNSTRTSPQKLMDMGFRFRYQGLDAALSEIYSH